MDDLEHRAAHLGWTEFYRAAFNAWLAVVLPPQWLDAYAADTAGEVQVVSIVLQQYEFLFDLAQERVVAVCGLSWKDKSPRDTAYMSEFLGVVTSERKLRELVHGLDAKQAAERRDNLSNSWRERFFEQYGARIGRGRSASPGHGMPMARGCRSSWSTGSCKRPSTWPCADSRTVRDSSNGPAPRFVETV